jgi:hypothetical protein
MDSEAFTAWLVVVFEMGEQEGDFGDVADLLRAGRDLLQGRSNDRKIGCRSNVNFSGNATSSIPRALGSAMPQRAHQNLADSQLP